MEGIPHQGPWTRGPACQGTHWCAQRPWSSVSICCHPHWLSRLAPLCLLLPPHTDARGHWSCQVLRHPSPLVFLKNIHFLVKKGGLAGRVEGGMRWLLLVDGGLFTAFFNHSTPPREVKRCECNAPSMISVKWPLNARTQGTHAQEHRAGTPRRNITQEHYAGVAQRSLT